jgi:peptide-methionine (R)-S-oxide reductase
MDEIKPINSKGDPYKVQVDEKELASRIDPLSFDVLRKAATETAFTGEYTDTETIGVYKCKACSAELFRYQVPLRMWLAILLCTHSR